METSTVHMDVSLSFDQVVNIIMQLPEKQKNKLTEILNKKDYFLDKEKVKKHLVSEDVLAEDWLRPEEDEAWKNL